MSTHGSLEVTSQARYVDSLVPPTLLLAIFAWQYVAQKGSRARRSDPRISPFSVFIRRLSFASLFLSLIRFLFLIQQAKDMDTSPPLSVKVFDTMPLFSWILMILQGYHERWLPTFPLLLPILVFSLLSTTEAVWSFLLLHPARQHNGRGAEEEWVGNGWTLAVAIAQAIISDFIFSFAIVAAIKLPRADGYDSVPESEREEDQQEEEQAEDGSHPPSSRPTTARAFKPGRPGDPHLQTRSFGDYYRRFRALIPFLWPKGDRKLQVLIISCFLILGAGRIVNILVPRQYKRVVDSLGGDGAPPRASATGEILWFVFFRSLQGGVGLLNTTQSYMWISVGQFTTREVSIRMFTHLHALSLRFHLGRKTGEILRVQDRGVNSIVSLLSSILFQIVPTLVDITLATLYFAYEFDLYFASVVLITMVSYIGATVSLTDWRTKFRRRSNDLENKVEARAVDSLLNFETVKYYGAEGWEIGRYGDALRKYQAADWTTSSSLNILNTAQNVIIQAGLLIGCLVCTSRVLSGHMTVGDVVLYLTYITQLYVPLNWFGTYYRIIQRNFVDMENMLSLFQEHVEVQDAEDAAPLRVTEGTVEFRDVSFAYDPRQPVLRNISFSIPGGSTVAIVGPSGGGKSTLLRLLFRFYDAQSGAITIDGQDIREVRQTELRASIGVVPQDTVLFNDDILYNIRYGRVTATDAEVWEAAKAAQIHDKILGFPDGYATKVGERGLRLSGGEKQRVAIARTILKDPPIVLLDEATSALDTHTERNIQSALRAVTRNRTTLIIAHRLSTVVHADVILVMEGGQIVERGSHAELMQAGEKGAYWQMWMTQLREEVELDDKRKEEGASEASSVTGDSIVPSVHSHHHHH